MISGNARKVHMAWTLADLEKLDKAIASGANSVRFQDKSITYNSPAEMMAIRNEIARSLRPRTRRGRARNFETDKGL